MRVKNNIFIVIILCFAGGVVLRSFLNINFIFSFFLLFLSFIFLLLWLFLRQKNVFLAMVVLSSFAFGILRFNIADLNNGTPILESNINKTVTMDGIIVDEPDSRENNTQLTVLLKRIFIDGEEIKLNTRGKIITDLYPKYEYGEEISLKGKLAKPRNFVDNKTGREFDYISYLWKDNIFYQMFYPKIKIIAKSKGSFVKEKLFSFKHAFIASVSRVIPEPASSLLGGLVVGSKQSLGKKLLDDFRTAGVIHIVVLSGYNVSIIAEALMSFFSFLPTLLSIFLGSGSIILFAIMTGAGTTIVRASIMALLVILARATGRTSDITRMLFIAGFVMVLFNPKILIFDISFQLSFLATLGLILFPPLLEKYFHFMPTKFQLREFALATISTQIFVLPILLYNMGQLSLVALPVNLLILIFIPLTMLFGFITGMVGFFSVMLSVPFAWITYGFLYYELRVVEIFSSVPFASIQIKSFPLWLMLAMYALYAWVIYRFWNRNTKITIANSAKLLKSSNLPE